MRVESWLAILSPLCLLASARAEDLHVAAAANLQKAFTEAVIPAFEQKTGAHVVVTYGATKGLAAQLENGAPEDVFVSADTETVDQLGAKHLLDPTTRRVYAVGQLVLWSRKDAPKRPRRLEDLRDPAYAKIALANPKTAPYGRAAQEALAKAGLTASVAPRLVIAENVAQAGQFAKTGNAEVAFTALSLVKDDPNGVFLIVSEKWHRPLFQAAGIVSSTPHPALARRFEEFLLSRDAAPIWRRYGYMLPKTPRR